MIQTDCPLTPIDDAERRRILAKVYEILLQFAEEFESLESSVDPVFEVERPDNQEAATDAPTSDQAAPDSTLNSSGEISTAL